MRTHLGLSLVLLDSLFVTSTRFVKLVENELHKLIDIYLIFMLFLC